MTVNASYNVAVFGGAFNPPHKGHLALAEYLVQHMDISQVLFAPSSIHRHKGVIDTDPLERVRMLQVMVDTQEFMGIETSDLYTDSKEEGAGSTLNLMDRVQSIRGSESNLLCIIGQDNADKIETFYQWKELINKYKFIVFPRGGRKPIDGAWYMSEEHIYLKDFELIDISSSMLREEVDRDLVPDEVYKYIKNNNLYLNVKKIV